MVAGLKIREAELDDAPALAEIHLAARREAMPYLNRAHTDDETRAYFARIVCDRPSAWWVARIGDEIVGYMLIDGPNLDHLYVRPGWQRRGVGLSLLTKAKALSPHRLELWTFQRNGNARVFYEAHGFRAVAYTGGRNEENELDVKYKWEPARSTTGSGGPPKTGWAKLVPELLVSDIGASLEFWCDRLGFVIAYQRPEEAFAYLERPEGAQIMLSQRSGKWETAPLDRPYGRGVMFQVYVASIEVVAGSLEAAGWPLYTGPRTVWREIGDCQAGQREIFVLDPDGYLVMVADDLGEQPLSEARS